MTPLRPVLRGWWARLWSDTCPHVNSLHCVCKSVNCARLNHRDPTCSHDYVAGMKCVMTLHPGKVHGGAQTVNVWTSGTYCMWRVYVLLYFVWYLDGVFSALAVQSSQASVWSVSLSRSGSCLILKDCFKDSPSAVHVFHQELLILPSVGCAGNVLTACFENELL